jgi:hypothetical protein
MPDRLALIIANSNFDDPKLRCLKTPVRDVKVLGDDALEVTVREKPTACEHLWNLWY